MVFAHFTTIAHRLKGADDWRNDEAMAGGDAFFEEGIHWLHIAGCLGPRIVAARGYRPSVSREGPDRRAKSMMVALEYDNQAVGALYYSREIPSLFKGLRVSKLFGRRGVITFESNGVFVIARGGAVPRLIVPGFRDIRGYQAMYRDFAAAIRSGRAPEMSLERAIEDQVLMDQIYHASAAPSGAAQRPGEPRRVCHGTLRRHHPRLRRRRRHHGARPGGDRCPHPARRARRGGAARSRELGSGVGLEATCGTARGRRWVDQAGPEFLPYTHYCVGGNTKFWGSVLYPPAPGGLRRAAPRGRRVAGLADRLRHARPYYDARRACSTACMRRGTAPIPPNRHVAPSRMRRCRTRR
jgi:hypothetical protein